MADNKKHHYVPKFYLRNFATDLSVPPKKRKQIHSFDVNHDISRNFIGLSDQCHSPYLYGKTPELEKALGGYEGECSQLFKEIVSNKIKNLDQPHDELYSRIFAILSIIRTPRQKRYLEDSLTNIMDKVVEKNFPDWLGQLSVSFDGFYHQAIFKIPRFVVNLHGTRSIIATAGEGSFVTSDNPVVRHNEIFRNSNGTHPCLGFLAKVFRFLSQYHLRK